MLNMSWPALVTLSSAEACHNDAAACQGTDNHTSWHLASSLGTRQLSRDMAHNFYLLQWKMRGMKQWSNRFLRFEWADDLIHVRGGSQHPHHHRIDGKGIGGAAAGRAKRAGYS